MIITSNWFSNHWKRASAKNELKKLTVNGFSFKKQRRRKYCLVVEYLTVGPFEKQIFDGSIIMRLLHRMWRTRSWLTLQPCEPNSAFFIRILCKFFRCKRLTKSSARARSVDESCWCVVCLIFIAEGHRSGLSRDTMALYSGIRYQTLQPRIYTLGCLQLLHE